MINPTPVPQRARFALNRWSSLELALLTLSVVSLALCCILTSAKKYFWFDELFSWTVVTDPSFSHMMIALWHGADGAPPLYHITTRVWTTLFGSSELAFRSASCAAFMVAVTVTWATLRRAFGRWPAAVATLFVFSLSPLILDQVAEARFYGLFTALVAIAIYLQSRVVEEEIASRGLLLTITLVHIALLYCHFYGVVYSAAILAAWIVSDRLRGRKWHAGYLAILVAWATFVPWLPAARAVADTGKPYFWIPVPGVRDLLHEYGFSLHGTLLVVAALLILGALTPSRLLADKACKHLSPRSIPRWRATRLGGVAVIALYAFYGVRNPPVHLPGFTTLSRTLPLPGHLGFIPIAVASVFVFRVITAARHQRPRRVLASFMTTQRDSLLLSGMFLLGVPVVSFIASHIGPSSFTPRYFIPASLGVAPAIAYMAWWSRGGDVAAPAGKASAPGEPIFLTASWALLSVALASLPALSGFRFPTQERPGIDVESLAPSNSSVVVESDLQLLPLRHYQRRHDISYVYPMDWAAAISEKTHNATVGFKLMAIWGRVGYADSTMLSGARLPCSDSQFVVLNSLRSAWFDNRVVADSSLTEREIGIVGASVMYLVHRTSPTMPAVCRIEPLSRELLHSGTHISSNGASPLAVHQRSREEFVRSALRRVDARSHRD